MKHVRRFIPRTLLKSVIQSEVISKVDYGNALYLKITKTQLGRLQLIINKAARLIFNLPRNVSITPYLRKLHWLPIGPRVDFKVVLTAKNATKTYRPKYLNEFLVPTGRRRGLFLRPRIEGGHSSAWRALKYSAPTLLNKIPKEIRDIENIETFKKKLKTYLFKEGFDYKLDSILDYTQSDSICTYRV